MRQIKFRAWDGKTMYPLFVINSETGKIVYNGQIKDWELMQYTGLKDKNGVEIYEGDVLKNNNDPELYIVIYQAPSFIKKWKIQNGYSKQWADFILSPDQNQFEEIIGNIHQNPELLTANEVM